MSTAIGWRRELRVDLFACALTTALPLGAQCGLQWQPGAPVSGIAGSVSAIAELPNGDVVAGGAFRLADGAVVNNVARHDGTTWRALGGGVDDFVVAVAALPNGDVVVTGAFSEAGGVAANGIARWNGSSWAPMGSGFWVTPTAPGLANALLVLPSGDLIAGGSFILADGIPAMHIARWDGTAWSALGSGLSQSVNCLGLRANGDLIVGGSFQTAGGLQSRALAVWNGTAWSAMPGLSSPAYVSDLAALPSGSIAVIGSGSSGPFVGIANGTTVQALAVPPGPWRSVGVFPNGDLVIGGYAQPGITGNVARWNGSVWTQIGNGAPKTTWTLATAANGDLIAAGDPLGTGVTRSNAIARYDGTSWTSAGAAVPAKVTAMVRLPDGDLVVGGEFTSIGGVAANHVARWRDGVVSPLGPGVGGPVSAMGIAIDGSVVVCGEFASAGGGPANRIARWTGSSWSTVGGGLPWAARAVAAAAGGQVLASFSNQIRYFDGLSWSPLAVPAAQQVTTFLAAPEGDFLVGLYTWPGGNAVGARFDHGVFSPTTFAGVPPNVISPLGTDVDGKVLASTIVAGGTGFGVQRLDGNTWSALGTFPGGPPVALASLPNGDPLAASTWPGKGYVLSRFDGSTWNALQSELEPADPASPPRILLASARNGEGIVGGDLLSIEDVVSAGFAYALPTCPSAAVAVGTGCTGAAGPLALVADNLPWLGGTFRSTASGFPPVALGVHALGTQPVAVPLPLGAPGCSLFVAPDLLALLVPMNGVAGAELAVPSNVVFAGLQLRTQVVALELDPSGSLIRSTSTNALQLTIGGL